MPQPAVFITGAASGIGRAVAERFAQRGAFVGLFDVDADMLTEVRNDLSDRYDDAHILHRTMDVTDPDSIQDAVNDFGVETRGRMDALFNSAGVLRVGHFEDLDLDVHRHHLDVNLWGVIAMTRTAFPLLRKTSGAKVISMASASGLYGTPELASYAATKAAVRSLTQALNLEWAHHDVYVCDVAPPYVNSPMTQKSGRAASMDRLGIDLSPEDVADVVMQAADEERVHWTVCQQFAWLYRASDVLPSSVMRLIMRYVSGF